MLRRPSSQVLAAFSSPSGIVRAILATKTLTYVFISSSTTFLYSAKLQLYLYNLWARRVSEKLGHLGFVPMPIWKIPFFPLPLKPAPVRPLPHKTDLFKRSQFHTKLWPLADKQACPYKTLPWWGQAPASPVEFTPRILKIYPSQGVLFFSTTICFPFYSYK